MHYLLFANAACHFWACAGYVIISMRHHEFGVYAGLSAGMFGMGVLYLLEAKRLSSSSSKISREDSKQARPSQTSGTTDDGGDD